MIKPYVSFLIRSGQVEKMTEPSFYKEIAIERFKNVLKLLSCPKEDYNCAVDAATEGDVKVKIGNLTVQFYHISYIDV